MKKISKNASNGKDAEWESLAKELRSLIPQLDSEGLAFLVQQARVHQYNMQVDKLNMAAEAANAASARATNAKVKTGKADTKSKSKAEGSLRIGGSESGSSYYLYYGNNDVMFSRDEIVRLVKIANGPGTNLEVRERLFNWFEKERLDVFSTIPITDKFDDRLKALITLLKKNFSIRNNS